jgi:acetyl esterase/lipase
MPSPPYLREFVLPTTPARRERLGNIDLYLPDQAAPRPAIVFVHGGPISADLRPTPRDWPVYLGYGSAAAQHGLIGVTVDHRFHGLADLPVSAGDVADAVEAARKDPRVDGGRIALWFFSGGGVLLADWLREPQPWLRCVAASYPVLGPRPDRELPPRFHPAEVLDQAGDLPIVLTRVGREAPSIAATVEAFVAAARSHGARLEVIDVPDGRHAFDVLDDTDESRRAIEVALESVAGHLNG